MEAPMVVREIEVVRKRAARVGVITNANLFVLERPHEPFANGVIGRGSGATHANSDSALAQDREVVIGAVRSAAIGVMNESRAWLSAPERHLQCIDRQRGSEMRCQRPADA